MTSPLRTVATLVLVAFVLVPLLMRYRAGAGELATSDGDTVEIGADARAAGFRFGADVPPADQQWILAAVAQARPEAARLIAEVDGLVQIGSTVVDGALGVTSAGPGGVSVGFDLPRLNNDRVMDRDTVVLHELGHVIDFALVPADINAQLDAQIPVGGPCGAAIDCDLPEERFADTFAKWALNGAVSEVGAGYGIAMPASIEGWGAPLAALAYELPAG